MAAKILIYQGQVRNRKQLEAVLRSLGHTGDATRDQLRCCVVERQGLDVSV